MRPDITVTHIIIVIGALLQISSTNSLIMWIAGFTVLITSINIAGGFAVTRRMLDILERLCAGRARADDLEQLEELADRVRRASLCGLGQTAPNPVLTTLRYFREAGVPVPDRLVLE